MAPAANPVAAVVRSVPGHPCVSLRPAQPADTESLYRIFVSARPDRLALLAADEVALGPLMRLQFDAQLADYEARFPHARHEVVLRGGEIIGRLYTALESDVMRLVDIALLPAHRGQGIGGSLIGALLDDAAKRGLPVALQVETGNPAGRLYERLGFHTVEQTGLDDRMQWTPARGRQGR